MLQDPNPLFAPDIILLLLPASSAPEALSTMSTIAGLRNSLIASISNVSAKGLVS